MKTREEIEQEYDQITGHENSFPVSPNNIQNVKDAEYVRGYKTALEWVMGLE